MIRWNFQRFRDSSKIIDSDADRAGFNTADINVRHSALKTKSLLGKSELRSIMFDVLCDDFSDGVAHGRKLP